MIPRRITTLLGVLCYCLAASVAQAADDANMVTLNFPENVELKVLVDYVAKRHDINFIYGQQVAGKKVTITAPRKVPADALLTLLESALKMNNMLLADTGVPGMMRIDVADQLTKSSQRITTDAAGVQGARPTLAVSRVFQLEHVDTARAQAVVAPFLSSGNANMLVMAERDVLIVTDYASNMPKLEELVSLVDRPGRTVQVAFVRVVNLEASAIAEKVGQMLEGKANASNGGGRTAAPVTLVADERTNQVAVMGTTEHIREATALIESLDVPLGLATKVYALQATSPEQMDRIVKELIGDMSAKRLYKSAVEREGNMLIVTTTAEIHEQIESLRQALDKTVSDDAQSPIRFYKLENAKAADVLATIQSITDEAPLDSVTLDGESPQYDLPRGTDESQIDRRPPPAEAVVDALSGAGGNAAALRDARVMVDEPTNTIIVIAAPSVHPIYEKLIARLDVRRPQVLIEATIVLIDTTDNFELGVEVSSSVEGVDGGTLLNFTQFGLGAVDPMTGALALSPGVGFNGALIGSDTAELIIRALKTDTRARVVSRPSVLINDNATGTLVSEAEEPFATVSVSGTGVERTTLGGFAAAGTNINITPQISEGDHLKLDYDVTLSSFTSTGTDTLPPARATNSLNSQVTIPDGYTIIVGGLTEETYDKTVRSVPLLRRIPVIKYLASDRSNDKSQSTLFVFLRAVVLRDDKFKDLKALSSMAGLEADLPDAMPSSEPEAME